LWFYIFLLGFGGFIYRTCRVRDLSRLAALVGSTLVIAQGTPALSELRCLNLDVRRLCALLLRIEHEASERLLRRIRITRLLVLLRLLGGGLGNAVCVSGGSLLGALGLLRRLRNNGNAHILCLVVGREELPHFTEVSCLEWRTHRLCALCGAEDEVGAEHTGLAVVSRLLFLLGTSRRCCGGSDRELINPGTRRGELGLEGGNLGLEDGLGGRHLGRREEYLDGREEEVLVGGAKVSQSAKTSINFFIQIAL